MNEDGQAGLIEATSEISNRFEEMIAAFGEIGAIARGAAAKLERNARGMMAATNKTYGPPSKKRKDDNYRIRVR